MSDTISLPEAARITGFHESTIRYKVAQGHVEATRDKQGRYRIPVETVRALVTMPRYKQHPRATR